MKSTESSSVDLCSTYFSGCSPYIFKLIYDLDRREVQLECARDSTEKLECKRLRFTDVFEFREVMFDDAADDGLTDSVVGIHLMENGAFCLHTEKREIYIRVGADPTSEFVE